MAAVLTVLYFDLRVRKEGFDLQLLARGVGRGRERVRHEPAGGRRGERARRRRVRAAPAGRRRFAPPAPPEQSGGFAPPQAPGGPRRHRPSRRPRPRGGLQSGDPLADAPPPERREGDGGAGS